MESYQSSLNDVPLFKVLPAPYQTVYAALLLAFSLPVTFAGAFLTLDRTRQFAPSGGPTTAKEKWRFEGGLGGLLGGWVFGVHLSTLLALLIMNRTSYAPLGGIQFLVIWLLSALVTSVLAGRWKYVAVPMIGIGGGAAFSLFVTVACHPAQPARVILLGVFSILSAILCLLPIPRVQHGAVRSAAAWMGALGIILSISILAGIKTWEDVWARLWVSWDASWGTAQEKGITAAFMGFAAVGIGVDWLLKRQFGECPDEKWDRYLSSYASQLPNAHDRPGNFTPSTPFWKKIFNPPPKDPILFPNDTGALSSKSPLSPPPYRAGKLRTQSKKSAPYSRDSFQPLNKATKHDFSSGSEDSSDEEGTGQERYIPRPWAKRKDTQATSLSGVTLADGASATSKGKMGDMAKEHGDLAYSDGESVAQSTSTGRRRKESRDAPGWTPEFIKRHSMGGKKDLESGGIEMRASRSNRSESPPPGAVPMTPSLMKALDRVSQAQNEAYAGIVSKGHTPYASSPGHAPGTSTPGVHPHGGQDWGAFWKKVEDKTREGEAGASAKSPR